LPGHQRGGGPDRVPVLRGRSRQRRYQWRAGRLRPGDPVNRLSGIVRGRASTTVDGHRFGARHLLVGGVLGVTVVAATLTVEGVGNTASPPAKHPAAQSAISLDPDGYPNRTRGLNSNGSRTVSPAGANGVVAVSGAVQTAMPFLEYIAT